MSTLMFGLNISPSAAPGADPVADAKRAEELGFDLVSTSDHPGGTQPTFEAWTMLAWLAAATSRIRIASRVLGVPYRSPAMVAKMAESLSRLSGGRLILGLGGGYSDEEFRAFGLGVPTPRDKVDGMEEAIRIARGMWSEPSFTFDGRLYRTEAADISPTPDRPIPIWLGTYGPRALAVTGRLADGWIPSLSSAPPDQVVGMRDRVRAAARDAGRDPDAITCAYNLTVRVDPQGDPDPTVVSGSAEAVAEQLAGFVRLGFSALTLLPVGPDPAQQVELLAAEVIPAVRAAGHSSML
jgi:probable F420-dependent oxidoreductase